MKLLIDMPKEKYEWIKKNNPNADPNSIIGALANGKPLANITDEQISDAFQIAIANYWEEKSKYLTPPPKPAQCPDCPNDEWLDIFIKKYNESRDFQIMDIRDREKLLDDLRPKGEWIFDGVYRDENNPIDNDMYHCSLCKRSIMTTCTRPEDLFPFCHCGADMRKAVRND